jgi:hypothetical protein
MGLGSGIRDPGSGKKPIPDPGVKKAPDPGSGFATLGPTTIIVTKSNVAQVVKHYFFCVFLTSSTHVFE